ncbi:MAG: HAMP domain-containing protein, partial [Candidatus Cloacimonetes bacterium]|nr:HAMP domain-containing protein [Candidatus Cloacimonadota bacterium]
MKQQSKIKFSIGKKLLVYFLLISLIPFIILGIISYSISKKHLKETITFSLSNLTQDCGRKISYYVNSNYQNINILSQADVFESNNNQAKQNYIEEVIGSFPDYLAITVIDLDGKIIACTRKDLIGNSRAERDWFRKTLRCKQGEVVPLDVYNAETAGWKMVLGYNTPITDETNKKVVGVLTTRVRMDHIIERVQVLDKRTLGNNHAYLLNRKGEILAGPDEKDFLTKYRLYDYPVVQKLLSGNTGIFQYINDRNEEVISAYYNLKGEGNFDGWGWGLIATESISLAFKSAFIIRNVTFYLLLIFSFIVIILAFVFSKTLSNPIKEISKAAQQISKGDLNQHLEVASSDEVGELADSFNDIQESLQEITGKARIIAGGDLNVQVDVRSQKDELAISLNEMVKSLQESDEFAKAILNSTQAGVVLINAETHIIEYANPVAEEMIGAEKEKINGNICYELICTASEGQCPITDKGVTIYNEEKILLSAKGEKVPVLNTVKSINIGDKKLLIETFVDISKLKEAELTAKR